MRLIGMGYCSADPPLGSGYVPFGPGTVVVGTNDAGKTSLLRLIRDELRPGDDKTPQAPGDFVTSTAFFVEASAAEVRFLVGRLVTDLVRTPPSTRDPRIAKVVDTTLAARGGVLESDPEGWPFGGWDPDKLKAMALPDNSPESLLHGLKSCGADPVAQTVLEGLEGSGIFAFEAERHSRHGWVWRVYWCLPPLARLTPELRDALIKGGFRHPPPTSGPRIQRWRRSVEQLPHLLQDEAPVLVAPLGRTTLQLLPKPIQVPADFEVLRVDLEDMISQFSAHVLRGPEGNWLGEDDDSGRDPPADPWVEEGEGLVSRVRTEIVNCASALASTINTLLPPLIADRYDVRLTILPVSAWGQRERLALEVAERQGGGPIPISAVAAGLQMWLQLAIFEAIHAFRGTMQILEICLEDWVEARIDLDELDRDGPANLEAEVGLSGPELRSEIESAEQAKRAQWEELTGAIYTGRMPRVKFVGLKSIAERLETRPGDDRERQLIELSAPTMYVLDEPERHLHPLWHLPMADWLQHRVGRNGYAQAVLATHAVPFTELGDASRLIYIRRPPGSRSSVTAVERPELNALTEIALDLGWDRGQLLSTIAVWLFVEGRADQAVLKALAGDDLRRSGVAVIPLHGESRASGIIDAEILLRYSSAAVAVWLDRVPADIIAQMLADPPSASRIARDKTQTPEIRTVAKLVAAATDYGREITPIPHPGGDIFDLLDEPTITRLFPAFPGHDHARQAAEASGMGQKQHYLATYGIASDVAGLQKIALEMVNADAPQHEAFAFLIQTCRRLARDRRLLG